MEDDLKINKNGRRPQQKMEMEDTLNFFLKLKWRPQKKWKITSKKLMEEDLQKKWKWKTTSKKMEDETINQNQPNWLWHHCKLN